MGRSHSNPQHQNATHIGNFQDPPSWSEAVSSPDINDPLNGLHGVTSGSFGCNMLGWYNCFAKLVVVVVGGLGRLRMGVKTIVNGTFRDISGNNVLLKSCEGGNTSAVQNGERESP